MSTDTQPTAHADYQLGEIVTVAATGRVLVWDRHGLVIELSPADTLNIALGPGVTVERQVPADGQPKPGDVWRDRYGHSWWCTGTSMLDSYGAGHDWEHVNRTNGPLTLAYRPEPTPDGE